MADLFDHLPPAEPRLRPKLPSPAPRPLADPVAAAVAEEVVGQGHLLGPSGPAWRMLADGQLGSIVFWGYSVGKTTIARLLAARRTFPGLRPISAIFTGVAELRKVDSARLRRQNGRGTLLFVDEIHRFNKAQRDAFLPLMEDGTIVLVGATTEIPSFELNGASCPGRRS